MSDRAWRIPAILPRVVDGDTVELTLSLGWHVYLTEIVRLYGVNCPEAHGKKASPEGITAANFTRDWIGRAKTLEVESLSFESRKDKYGRTLGRIFRTTADDRPDPVSLNQALLDSGNGVAYMV
jgi:endonuclease YncB( thermonuclease family)